MRSIALRLLITAGGNSKITLVSRRVGCVRTLVVLDIARPGQRIGEVIKCRIPSDLELPVGKCGDGRGRNTSESTCEGLKITSGSGCGGRRARWCLKRRFSFHRMFLTRILRKTHNTASYRRT